MMFRIRFTPSLVGLGADQIIFDEQDIAETWLEDAIEKGVYPQDVKAEIVPEDGEVRTAMVIWVGEEPAWDEKREAFMPAGKGGQYIAIPEGTSALGTIMGTMWNRWADVVIPMD